MSKTSFKTGDAVKIVKNTGGHYFPMGEVGVVKVNKQGLFVSTPKAGWWVDPTDIQLVKSKQNQQKMSNNTTVDATRRGLVLATAQTLLAANNKVTTLEIKTELRVKHSGYYWTQDVVSACMDDFSNQGAFDYTDNGTFRTYFDPTKTPQVKAPKVTNKAPKKTTSKATKVATNGSITRNKALKLMANNKGRYFTVTFIKKEDGSTRVMNCQWLSGQTTGTGYVKVKEASLVRAKDPNPIRQFALDSLKILSIGGNTMKVRK